MVIKSIRMVWARHVASIREMYVNKILTGKPEGKRALG
jgi:hypothetical protein